MSGFGGKDKLQDDPRIHPRIKEFFCARPELLPVRDTGHEYASYAEQERQVLREMQKMMTAASGDGGNNAPPEKPARTAFVVPPETRALWRKQGLSEVVHTLASQPDGNEIKVLVIRPADDVVRPAVYYIHGGGMARGSAFAPEYKVFGRILAHQGVVACLVDFRNSLLPAALASRGQGIDDTGPYPCGLNDCLSGLRWLHARAAELGANRRRICVAGESGGGNLALAIAMRCARDGTVTELLPSGVYALCPYIAGCWPQDLQQARREVPILGESHLNSRNNGIFLDMPPNLNPAMGYGIEAFRRRDPLAWPGFATESDVAGLPRCVISVNECDPLHDEGVAFYRLLVRAGVDARCRVVVGTVHCAELFPQALPEVCLDTARCIADFAAGSDARPPPTAPSASKL